MKKLRLWIGLVFTVLAIAAVSFGYSLYRSGIFGPDPGYTPIPFTAEAWQDADPEVRGHMTDDLLDRNVLDGMSRDEVIELLGEPDFEFGNSEDRPQSLAYDVGYLGMNPNAMFVFRSILHISFEDDGIIKDTYIDN